MPALTRVAPFMGLPKRQFLMNASSQFHYRPLIWMSHSCINSKKIKGFARDPFRLYEMTGSHHLKK